MDTQALTGVDTHRLPEIGAEIPAVEFYQGLDCDDAIADGSWRRTMGAGSDSADRRHNRGRTLSTFSI